MPLPIEQYAVVGDCHTAALVGSNGSIDWLCLPRFDSPSMFGALLGTEDHGRWLLAPSDADATSERAYDADTLVLRTRWTTAGGEVEVVDVMPVGDRRADLIRRVRGIRGTVRMRQDLRVRFGYADALPWMRQLDDGDGVVAIAGPDAVVVRGAHLEAIDHAHAGEFDVAAGETRDLVLTWYPSHRDAPAPMDDDVRIEETTRWWRDWIGDADAGGRYRDAVRRSLLLLRALTHEDTGGIVAAATTSLPEEFGGPRNWDYRYVWLRDASLTLDALISRGFRDEAARWRGWLLRAIAGDPGDVQIMYGIAGERRLEERELPAFPGYDGASPVRVGNAAYRQYQGDVFGEVMLALQRAREAGAEESEFSWPLQRALMTYVEQNWRRPDQGIWEIRGEPQHFVQSRAMIWAAFDSAVRAVRRHGLDGPVERWEALRDEVRAEIEAHGVEPGRGCFVQHYGSSEVDASLLTLSAIGFVAPDDPRMLATVAAIESDLMVGGLVYRYRTETGVDGLPAGENPFLACSFWLVEQYAVSGRLDDAVALMDRLVALANDVGMLSEQIEPRTGRHAGNTPQALSHLALVRAAEAIGAARARS
ncbi:glycoside hydrolase family 15 protein [Galbitalea sp. SE-J8]|uniref:glycoside hydrolase family 15 protein n=1 Tax=Galbitalea sp. SE-J8 TaxID=3054952 RepID=UPI00259C87E6|nr:glycoside hydrolase family 15 protein [Galbitalea sp. SE-J8]MDM4761787.1 glycoside hydrolase family 15 protein [Galbitalea sp. SE-J8]